MKVVKHVCYTLLCIAMPYLLQAQPPGYIGKRAFLSLGISSKPSITGPTQNGYGTEDEYDSNFQPKKSIGIDYEFEGNFSYVVGRYSTLGLTVGQYHTGMFSTAESISLGADLLNFSGGTVDYHELFERLSVRSIALTYSKYNSKKGAIAPLGNHVSYGIKRSFITGEILDKYTNYFFEEIGDVYGHDALGIDDEKVAYNTFLIGWSNHQIFFDKLLLKVGFRFGIPLSSKAFDGLADDANNDPNYRDYFEEADAGFRNRNRIQFEYDVYERIVRHEALRIDVSVGYLLF